MARILLDTTVFNRVLDGQLSIDALAGHDVFATHVQVDEIERTRCDERRRQLCETFRRVGPAMLATSSAVFDVSRWDASGWGGRSAQFAPLREALDRENGGHRNNVRDILAAETAVEHGLTLVTDDEALRNVMIRFGFSAARSADVGRL